jgi:signal transduction histidine kinase
MNRLLDDVLFFSRSEADKIKVECEHLMVGDYVAQLVESMNNMYPDRSILIDNRIPEQTEMYLDPHLLDHICHNLIGNAFKYSTGDSEVKLLLEKNHDQLEITVIDHGIGIPEKDREHLFEPFHRADNVGNRKGTGLGLNIAMRAADLLGGSLSFTSKQDDGSSFVLKLPIQYSLPEKDETDNTDN